MSFSLNYISEFSPAEASGGWDGINSALVYELRNKGRLHYVGPVHPREDYTAKVISKLRRIIGLRGAFSAYSKNRLEAYARKVRAEALCEMDADFFHGATPWVCCSSPRKYFTYIDACFHTFLTCYQSPHPWAKADLARIYRREKEWLEKAERIFISSSWAAEETRRAYNLDPSNFQVVGVGGAMPVPSRDAYRGGRRFVAVMTDFVRKGGRLCVQAFGQVLARHPDAILVFAGQAPPPDVLGRPGIQYAGFFDKRVKEERLKLADLLSSAFALLLPSKAETSPIVIAEAGYFGCPTIAPRRFGIPEMVLDGRTGLLLEGEVSVDNLATSMLRLCRAGADYFAMRTATREHCLEHFTWKRTVDRIAASLNLSAGI